MLFQLWVKFKLVTIVMMLAHHYLLLEVINPIKISLSLSLSVFIFFLGVFGIFHICVSKWVWSRLWGITKDFPCLLFVMCASYVELDGLGKYQITSSCRTATSRGLILSVDTTNITRSAVSERVQWWSHLKNSGASILRLSRETFCSFLDKDDLAVLKQQTITQTC